MNRQEYNKLVLDMLIAAVERFPEQRFGQILRNLEIIKENRDEKGNVVSWVNDFNTESKDIAERVGHYRQIMRDLGAYVDNNALMAVRRLKLDKKRAKKFEYDETEE